MTNKAGDCPPHEVTSLLHICFLRAWNEIYRAIELFGKTKKCETAVDGLQSTQITRNNVRLNRIPCRPGLLWKAEDKIRFWVLPPTMFTQVLTKSKLRNKNQETIWFVVFFSCKQANTIKFPADQALRKAADKIRIWVFASSNVYTSLTQIQNPNAKKHQIVCKL